MKIGSGANINVVKFNVSNMPEKKEEEASDKLQDVKAEGKGLETQKSLIPKRPEKLNLLAGSFMHQEGANDSGNYSLKNLKSLKSSENLMMNFSSFMTDLIDNRVAYTMDLIDSGIPPMDAKIIAADTFEKMGVEAHEKLVDDITQEELEKEVEESKEFNEERTEEVIEEKQEEKAVEAKESEEEVEAKIEEKIAESVDFDQTVEGVSAGGAADPVSSIESSEKVIVTDLEESSSASTDEGIVIKGFGIGKNVDELV